VSDDALVVLAPVPGRVVAMADVPDEVFAASLVGPGVALDPPREPGDAVAPVAGRIAKLHPHAFVVVAVLPEGGAGVLVHLGIDTVKLEGAPFTLHAAEGDQVTAGDRVVSMDVAAVRAAGMSPVTPVVVMDAKAETVPPVESGAAVATGDVLFTWPAGSWRPPGEPGTAIG
jgi:PTS system glucose-specific IIA component/PTS system N-acetylglucosamine-specific IIA component